MRILQTTVATSAHGFLSTEFTTQFDHIRNSKVVVWHMVAEVLVRISQTTIRRASNLMSLSLELVT